MGRFRLRTRPPTGTDLASGVTIHHRTDDLFHNHRWFVARAAGLTRSLLDAGVPRGAARASGHIGVELLLDGLLLSRPTHHHLVGRALAWLSPPDGPVVDLVAGADRQRWHHHLRLVADHPVPTDNDRPDVVADRLRRILASRPRLALPAGTVPTVADALADHQADVIDGGDDLVAELASGLAPDLVV